MSVIDSNNSVVSIEIPDNAEPGDILTFIVNGNELELEIPVGSKVGDVLQIQLAQEQQHASEEEEEEEISIKLPNNDKILKLLQKSSTNNDIVVEGDDGTNGLIWPSARYLIESGLLSNLPSEESSPVLELGSGLGVIGLAYASSNPKSDLLQRVVLTDIPSSMSLLQKNVTRNQNLFSDNNVKVETKSLEWSSTEEEETFKFPIILGSDLLYNPKVIPDLVNTLKRCWQPDDGCIVMSIRWRKPELERTFFQLTEDEIEWELYNTTTSEDETSFCSLSWKDFGNPTNENSNKYFSQTMISVGNKHLKPLSEITEHEVENSMSVEEYNTWERAFIQIYIGKRKE